MKKLLKRYAAALLAAAMTASLAACGGSSSSGSTSGTGEAQAEEAQAEEAQAENGGASSEADEPAEVRTIAVGMMASLYPYCYMDDNDEIVGFDVDMLAEMDARMPGYTFTVEDLQYAVLFESLETGAVDMLTGSINRTEERDAKYMTPSVDSGYNVCSLVVAEDNTDINGLDDMGGKKIAFDPTRAEYPDLVAWNDAHPDNPMIIEEMSDPSQADMVKMVADGRMDAALIYRDSFPSIQEELALPVKMLDEPSVKKAFTQLINDDMEGAQEFCDEFSKVLQEIIDDGTLSALSEKWLGFDMYG